jgi:hypothetical protein
VEQRDELHTNSVRAIKPGMPSRGFDHQAPHSDLVVIESAPPATYLPAPAAPEHRLPNLELLKERRRVGRATVCWPQPVGTVSSAAESSSVAGIVMVISDLLWLGP